MKFSPLHSVRSGTSYIYSQLTLANSFKVPHVVKIKENVVSLELHEFCDASNIGFGACFFSDPAVPVEKLKVLWRKSRVAPIKQISIPRLKLNAALLLSCLFNMVNSVLGLNVDSTYLWSDSKVAFHWLSSLPNSWKTFFTNQVCEMQEFTQCCVWKDVPLKDNPEDILSDACSPDVLSDMHMWLHDPSFFQQPKEYWPLL